MILCLSLHHNNRAGGNSNNSATIKMTTSEFIKKIENKKANVLTVERAGWLKGKTVYWFYYGYTGNQNKVLKMTIGDIVSELEYYSTQPCEGYASRAEYWKSYMTEEQLKEKENTLLLLDSDGNDKFIRAHLNLCFFDKPTFTCSDADREIYYIRKNTRTRVELTDKYTGRSITLSIKNYTSEEYWYNQISNGQRRKIENFFGEMAAYYTSVEIL